MMNTWESLLVGHLEKNKLKTNIMRYSIWRDVFTGLYYTTLLGGEFANCHGQGSTADEAVISLKIRVNQLRRKL